MLWSIVGNVFHRVAVVTFDSSPKLIQTFTPDLDESAVTVCHEHAKLDRAERA
jgi:hypothetical protein